MVKDKKFISERLFWNKSVEKREQLVKKEAKLIKNHFTGEEIAKLELDIVDGDAESRCIYGTMVGTCNSERVLNYIKDNLNTLVVSFMAPEIKSFDDVDVFQRSYNYFITPLEEYIITQDFDGFRDAEADYVLDSVKKRIEQVINWINE